VYTLPFHYRRKVIMNLQVMLNIVLIIGMIYLVVRRYIIASKFTDYMIKNGGEAFSVVNCLREK